MYLGGDLPERQNGARYPDDVFAPSAESLRSSTDQRVEEIALQELSNWERAKERALEAYGVSSDDRALWNHFISTTYHCLTVIAPLLDDLPSEITDRVKSDVVPVAVDRVTLCSLEERIAFVEAVAKSNFLSSLPVPPITAELLPGERVGDFVIRRVFCTHSIDQTFGNNLSLLTEGVVHLQKLFDEFQPSRAVTTILEECLLRFGQIKFRQWNDSMQGLDESQLRFLRVFSSLVEQLGQLDGFLLRTSNSLLGLLEKLDPDGSRLVRDRELNALLLSIHRVNKEPVNEFVCRTMKIRAGLLLEATTAQTPTSQRLAELHSAVRAGALDSSHRDDIHQLLTTTSIGLPEQSLVTYRDWLVVAATTKFSERSALAIATTELNLLDNKLRNKLSDEDSRRLVVDCCRSFFLLRSTLLELSLQNSLKTAVGSVSNVLLRTSYSFDQRELYQILPLFIAELDSSALPFNETSLKRLTPQDHTSHTDSVVTILCSLASRFSLSPGVTRSWFRNGFCQPDWLAELSDQSITRLLLVAEPHLTSDSALLAQAFYRCFADTGKEKDARLLRRTCLAHAHLRVQPIPQALRMAAEIIQHPPDSISLEQAQEKIPVLFALLWWIHVTQNDTEFVTDGCNWIDATNMKGRVRWSDRDIQRWEQMPGDSKSKASRTPKR